MILSYYGKKILASVSVTNKYRNVGSLLRLPQRGIIDVSLATLQCEIFTISPVKVSEYVSLNLFSYGVSDS